MSFVSTALRTGIPFGVGMGVFFGIKSGAAAGAVSGAACGVLFGVVMAGFQSAQRKRLLVLRDRFVSEDIVFDGLANELAYGRGATGGALILTRKRLVFVPHKLNAKTTEITIPVSQIAGVTPNAKLDRFTIGANGKSYVFIVENRDPWLEALKVVAPNA